MQILTAGIMTKTIPRIIPTGKIMKKLAITRKLMIAVRSKRGGKTGGCDAAKTDRFARPTVQPIRELLLQIYSRCSYRQQSMQFKIAGAGNRQRRLGKTRREIAL